MEQCIVVQAFVVPVVSFICFAVSLHHVRSNWCFFPTSLCGVLVFGWALPRFLLLRLRPPARAQLVHTQLVHTQLTHTHSLSTHTHNLFTHAKTSSHTQLAHTQLAHTQLAHTLDKNGSFQ